MKKRNLNSAFVLLFMVGGCSQIIGLGDYDIDPKLDGKAGSNGGIITGGEAGEGGSGATAGKAGSSGSGAQPQGGAGGEPVVEPSAGQAGEAPNGGAGGSEPGKVLIPCDSAACCSNKGGKAVGEELLNKLDVPAGCNPTRDYCDPYYGGFEFGAAADGNSPWEESSSQNLPLVTDGTAESSTPHRGKYHAFLAGVHDEESVLISQPIEIPSDAGWLVLNGYRLFELDRADPSDSANGDVASLSLWDDADPLEVPFYWDYQDPGAASDWTKFENSFDAAPHQGKTRFLYVTGSTDDWSDADGTGGAAADFPNSSNYMYDDVSLKVFRCYAR